MPLVVEGRVLFSQSGAYAWRLVENEEELLRWWETEGVTTVLLRHRDHDSVDRYSIDLRDDMRARATDGQRATLTIEAMDTRRGRNLRLGEFQLF